MAAVTTTAKIAAAGPAAWFRDLIRAEWTKFRATRSTYYSLASLLVIGCGAGALIAQAMNARWPFLTPQQQATFDPLLGSARGFEFGQLVIGTLGVLMISTEYSTGLIRTTLAAVPQRRSVLAAKAVLIGTVALIVGVFASFVTFFVTQDLQRSTGRSLSIGSPGALRSVIALAFYLSVIALIGLALGTLIRHTAGAVSALFALVFLLPGVISSLPQPWDFRIGKWLPNDLAAQLVSYHAAPDFASRPTSLVILIAYPVVLLTAAAVRLSRSDA